MFNLSNYCGVNGSLTEPWKNNGLNQCFINTVTTSITTLVILLFGLTQIFFYKKYATPVEDGLKPNSCFYKIQICLIVLLPSLAITRFILQAIYLYQSVVYGYMLLVVLGSCVSWILCLVLINLERNHALPSIPSRGHGLVLVAFWTLVFIGEGLALVSLNSATWFWKLKNTSDKISLGLWVGRFSFSFFLFILGLKGPGLPNYAAYATLIEGGGVGTDGQEGGRRQLQRDQGSTWVGLWEKFKLIAPYVWPKGQYLLQLRVLACFGILVIGRVTNLYTPLFYKYIVDSLTPVGASKNSTASLHGAPVMSLGSIVLSASGLLLRWDLILAYVGLRTLQGLGAGGTGLLGTARTQLWIRVQQYTTREMGLKLFAHLHALSLRWHLAKKTGEVLRIVDRGTDSINGILNYVIFSILPTIFDIIIGVVYFAAVFNIYFGIIVLVTMALYMTATILVTEWRTKFRRTMNRMDNEKNAKAVDSLLNFETVKYYGAEEYEVNNYRQAILAYQDADYVSTWTLNLLNTVQNFIINAGFLAGALLCAYYVVEGKLTVGDFVLFCTYIIQLYMPLNWFGTYYRMIQQNFIDMENMFELFDENQEVADVPNAQDLIVKKGEIEFRDVCFYYEPEKPILKAISFRVPPGHTVALVGNSGGGKSTVIRLLFRFYDVHSGSIRIDGQDISKVKQSTLRQAIGVVPQDTVLFNTSILYNIRYGRVEASDEEVKEAADAADIHERILTFPSQYDTVVGERGLKLSGGEKQRVAIARTLLKAPKIVLLDEATSALDTQTERNIQASLNRVCENRTTLIVAHRLSTIVHANEILVMHDGDIVERGSHEHLLNIPNGRYAAMWQQQSRRVSRGKSPIPAIGEEDEEEEDENGAAKIL